MNIEELENKKTKNKNEENLAKIAISKEADRALVEVLNRIDEKFDAGRATKQDLASHIIMRFFSSCTEKEIHDMRVLFFDPITAMEVKMKRIKETGVIPDSIRDLLLQEFLDASPQPSAKKIKKSLNQNIIIDNVDENKESA